jgi:CRP/FNR family transcriptional regulator, cyclic AMP receptor protein
LLARKRFDENNDVFAACRFRAEYTNNYAESAGYMSSGQTCGREGRVVTATSDEAKTLRWIDGFKELSAPEIRQISARCHWRWYRPGERIVSQDDATNDVFFIVQGRVRITNYSTSGKEVSFRDMTFGQIFGELAAIDGLPRSASAVALSDSLLASMSAKAYWDVLQSHPPLAANCLKRLAYLVRALSSRVIEFATMPVRDRVCAELLRLATRDESDRWQIHSMPTHAELANRVATHREAVTRVLHGLESGGLILRDGKKLILRDRDRLRRALGEEPGHRVR